MILLIAIVLIIVCWVTGGQIKGRIRDIPVPVILALALAIQLKTWWLFLALGATFQIIRLGYGNKDPNDSKPSFLATIIPDYNGWWIRSAWGLLVSTIGALPLVLGHFLGLWAYLGYILLNTVVNFLVTRLRLNVYLTDILVSANIASILFFLRYDNSFISIQTYF
jgi:hypothetical protein